MDQAMSERSARARAGKIASRLRAHGFHASVDGERASSGRVYVNVYTDSSKKASSVGWISIFTDSARPVAFMGDPILANFIDADAEYKGT